MNLCKKYCNGEECPYGDKCKFLHEDPAQFRGTYRKTKLCLKWKDTGYCSFGKNCHFTHGEEGNNNSFWLLVLVLSYIILFYIVQSYKICFFLFSRCCVECHFMWYDVQITVFEWFECVILIWQSKFWMSNCYIIYIQMPLQFWNNGPHSCMINDHTISLLSNFCHK